MKKFLLFGTLIFLCLSFAVFYNPQKNTKTTVQFASWGSQSEISFILPLIKEFEKNNPDIKIEFLHIPQNYFQKIHLLFASSLAPDVVFVNNYYAPKYIKANLFEDLTPYINQNEYFEKAVKNFTYKGKIYAIPRDISDVVIYYNKDLFKQNKIKYPASDWTIDEYLEIAKKLSKDTNNDGLNDLWGTSFETDFIFWLPFVLSNGGQFMGKDQNTLNIIKFYTDIANKYNAAPKKFQSSSLTMAQLFLQQKIAMQISGRWLVPKYRQEAGFDWDIVQFPKGKKGSIVNIDASGYAISKSSKHKKEALRFIKFMSSEKSLEKLSQSGLIVPARPDCAYSDKFLEPSKKPENAIAFLDAIKTGVVLPVNEDYQKTADDMKLFLEPVFLGKKKEDKYLP